MNTVLRLFINPILEGITAKLLDQEIETALLTKKVAVKVSFGLFLFITLGLFGMYDGFIGDTLASGLGQAVVNILY